jgi:hypothetical protein
LWCESHLGSIQRFLNGGSRFLQATCSAGGSRCLQVTCNAGGSRFLQVTCNAGGSRCLQAPETPNPIKAAFRPGLISLFPSMFARERREQVHERPRASPEGAGAFRHLKPPTQ